MAIYPIQPIPEIVAVRSIRYPTPRNATLTIDAAANALTFLFAIRLRQRHQKCAGQVSWVGTKARSFRQFRSYRIDVARELK